MLLVAFSINEHRGLPQAELWLLLAATTLGLLVGAGMMGYWMVPEYQKTFYKVNIYSTALFGFHYPGSG